VSKVDVFKSGKMKTIFEMPIFKYFQYGELINVYGTYVNPFWEVFAPGFVENEETIP
jgi:hypothetical protein